MPQARSPVAAMSEAHPSQPALQALHLISFLNVVMSLEGPPQPDSQVVQKALTHSSLSDLCSILPSQFYFKTSLTIISARKPSLTSPCLLSGRPFLTS